MRFLASILAIAVISACTTTYNLTPVPADGQELDFYKGIPTVTNYGEKSVVSLSPSSKSFEERAGFFISVLNDGAEPEVLDTTNLEIVDTNGQVKVFSAAELEKEARNAAAWQAFAVAMSSASNSYANSQAAYSSSYTTARTNTYGNVYSPYGTATYNSSGYGTATTTTYNPAITQALEAENRARTADQMKSIQSGLQATLNEVSNHILQATTVYPGQTFGGKVVVSPIRLSKGQTTVQVAVNFAGDTHQFTFDAAAIK